MSKKTDSPQASKKPTKRLKFLQNLRDSYTITKRSFPWLPWAILGSLAVVLGLNIWYMVVTKTWVFGIITTVLLAIMLPMLWLSLLISKAMLRQIEGMKGCVGALGQMIRRSWVADKEPVAFNKDQDMVWRFIGPKGIVLVSEGPHSRVKKLLDDEVKKTTRVASAVAVHTIESGQGDGQVRLEKVLRAMYRLPKALSRHEIPAVQKRLQAIHRKDGLPIPKGIDPHRVRPDRRALYG